MTLLDYLFAVIPMLGILIFVHELGHFLVAKWIGVRVLKFSLGFGPPVGIGRMRLRWVRNGTEYVVAWFPLGGFVKVLGEQMAGVQGEELPVPDAAPDEYLNAKRTWQKFAFTFAGPAMNLLLPVVAYMAMLAVGIPQRASVVGMVESGSPALEAGLRAGDRILALDGEPVQWWADVETAIRERTVGEIAIRALRGEEELAFDVPVARRRGLDPFGGAETVGWIGVGDRRLPALIGIATPDTRAEQAGLRSGDRVVSVGGQAVEDWEAFASAYAQAGPGEVRLEVEREVGEEPIFVSVPALGDLQALQVVPATILVRSVSEGFPAQAAGLQPGDLIVAVDGRPVGSFGSFQETVRASEGRVLEIVYARGGETTKVSIQPELRQVAGPLGIEGMEEDVYLIGITHALATLPGAQALDRVRNPFVSVPRAIGMTIETTSLFLRGFSKLITGEVGADKLTGPIGIAEIARKSLDLGWQVYLHTMILISINLGILNLLPIPILDGGQALIFAVEGIKRSPISLRTRELVQSFGLTVLALLMGLAFWNDLSRHWSNFVEWLRGTGL